MEKVALPIHSRTAEERAKDLRRGKLIPAVVYGEGFENLHLKIDYQTFRRIFEKSGYSTIITLEVEGGQSVPVLVHEVQYHPVSDEMTHIDFYAVRMDKKVETHVQLVFTGLSEAIKLGAVLNTLKHELQMSCLPMDLVHHIEVDISVLEHVGDTIHVSDITAPKGVEILDGPEDTICTAVEPQEIVEEEPEAAEAEEGAEAEEAGVEGEDGEGKGEGEKKGE